MLIQVYDLSNQFLPKEWIMAKWEEGFYITAMAGSTSGSSLVVMSKGTPYTQQSYKVCADTSHLRLSITAKTHCKVCAIPSEAQAFARSMTHFCAELFCC